jgi:hypothetical protein
MLSVDARLRGHDGMVVMALPLSTLWGYIAV